MPTRTGIRTASPWTVHAPTKLMNTRRKAKCDLTGTVAFTRIQKARGYITKNPVAHVNLPEARAKSSGIRLKVREIRAILRIADEHPQRVLIYFLVILGTR